MKEFNFLSTSVPLYEIMHVFLNQSGPGKAHGHLVITIHPAEGVPLGKQLAQQLIGQGVTRAPPDIAADNRATRKCKIAHSIQHFVTHRLIRMPHAAGA